MNSRLIHIENPNQEGQFTKSNSPKIGRGDFSWLFALGSKFPLRVKLCKNN